MPWWVFDLGQDFLAHPGGTLIASMAGLAQLEIRREGLSRMRDSEVEQQVLRSFKLDSAVAGTEICVESQDGVVTLSGTSPTYRLRAAFHAATLGTPGVSGVVNKIEFKVDRLLIAAKSQSANASALALNVLISHNDPKFLFQSAPR
jgi:hypothetical protein